MPLAGLPAGALGAMTAAGMNRFYSFIHACGSRLVGRYPGWQNSPCRLPRRLFQGAQWLDGRGGALRRRLL